MAGEGAASERPLARAWEGTRDVQAVVVSRVCSLTTLTVSLAAALGGGVHSLFLWVRITWCWKKKSICFLEFELISRMRNCKL